MKEQDIMGITANDLSFIRRIIGKNPKNKSICELGDQICRKNTGFAGRPAKFYYESLGMKHMSIDINGKNYAVPLDLTRPINVGEFDFVTNCGTSEHVTDQFMCFYNINGLCKIGGIMIHMVPLIGHWLKHKNCYCWYTPRFFKELSIFGYEVIVSEINGRKKNLVYAVLKKKENLFNDSELFYKILKRSCGIKEYS